MERGFARNLPKNPLTSQLERLAAEGFRPTEIYDDAEGLDACIMAFRGQPGVIMHVADLRIFGDTQAAIAEAVSKCEEAGIRIVDIAHPELKTVAAQLKHAFAQVAFMRRWDGDKRKARRTGANGGKAKAEHQAVKREGLISKAAVQRLVGKVGKTLTWRDIEEVTEISTATLRRHYL